MNPKSTNILITGGSGMVGHALKSIISSSTDRYHFISSKDYDLTNIEQTKQMFETIKPDYVIHLAAIVGDPACSKFSEEAKETNWDGSVILFEECEKYGIERPHPDLILKDGLRIEDL